MRNSFKINNRLVGCDQKPLVIAEIGINHGGSLQIAKEMVVSAKNAGAEIIKHQTHIIEDEMSSEAKNIKPGNADISIFEIMEKCSLSNDEEYELMKFTEDNGLIFFRLPFQEQHFIG